MANARAILNITAVEITCSKCRETIPAANGSLFWTYEELVESVMCKSCNRTVWIGAVQQKLKG